MTRLDVLDLAKTLGSRDRAAILRGVTLHLPPGRCLGLQGATGSGKTTLLRIIAGLERPDRGEVRLNHVLVGSPTVHVPPDRRRIGFVFQGLGLWPHLSVERHLDYVLDAARIRGDERLLRKAEVIHALRLRGLLERRPGELSGGEKHLLALARALVGDVQLLLLDEPFAGLDGRLKTFVLQALRRLLKERSLSTLLVSHLPGDFEALCQGVLHLQEGHLDAAPGEPCPHALDSGRPNEREENGP